MAFLKKRFSRRGYFWYLVETERIKGRVVQKVLKYLGKTRDAYIYTAENGLQLPRKKSKSEIRFDQELERKLSERQKEIKGSDLKRSLEIAELFKRLIIEWTYHSTVIEGSSLTKGETKNAIDGIEVLGKPLEDSVGAKNHKDAIIYMFKLLDKKKELTEQDILEFHHLVLKGINDQYAGRYRDVQVIIRGAVHNPPSSGKVPIMMRELVKNMKTNLEKLSPADLSAAVHLEFEKIHPFVDGNGRVGRIINNFLLISAGCPPIIIKINERKKYFEALEESIILDRPEPFIRFIKMKVIDSYKFYSKKKKRL